MSNTVNRVQEKIESDRDMCKSIIESQSDKIKKLPPIKGIRCLFPDIFKDGEFSTSNLPLGVRLTHYLLFGVPAVVNIVPSTDREFREKHGISIKGMIVLAEEGLVIPNLYARNNLEVWDKGDDLASLIDYCSVIGERVDQFLKVIFPKYHCKIEKRINTIAAKLPESKKLVLKVSPEKKERVLEEQDIKTIATRWVYLDIFAPGESKEAERILEEEGIQALDQYVHDQKWLKCTDVTGCVGGDFVFGPDQIGRLFFNKKNLSDHNHRLMLSMMKDYPALEYLLSELTDTVGIGVLNEMDVKPLIKFFKNDENLQLRSRIVEGARTLMKLAINDQLDTSDVREFKEMIENYKLRSAKDLNIRQVFVDPAKKKIQRIYKETIGDFIPDYFVDLTATLFDRVDVSPYGFREVKQKYLPNEPEDEYSRLDSNKIKISRSISLINDIREVANRR